MQSEKIKSDNEPAVIEPGGYCKKSERFIIVFSAILVLVFVTAGALYYYINLKRDLNWSVDYLLNYNGKCHLINIKYENKVQGILHFMENRKIEKSIEQIDNVSKNDITGILDNVTGRIKSNRKINNQALIHILMMLITKDCPENVNIMNISTFSPSTFKLEKYEQYYGIFSHILNSKNGEFDFTESILLMGMMDYLKIIKTQDLENLKKKVSEKRDIDDIQRMINSKSIMIVD